MGISTKAKVTAFQFCFFLGVLGAHHFYVGNVGRGFLYLFTFGGFGFGAFYDLFIITMGKFVDSDGNYLN